MSVINYFYPKSVYNYGKILYNVLNCPKIEQNSVTFTAVK